jgi:hypothetical protein
MIDDATTEIGIRHALLIERAEGRKKTPAGLGFAQINYGRLFVRDYWTLFAIARELDCSIDDLTETKESPRTGPRWSELISASEEILETVRTLPVIVRDVVTMRCAGFSWRRIQQRFPHRVSFSLRDDHTDGLCRVRRSSHESLLFLATTENIFVVKDVRAA